MSRRAKPSAGTVRVDLHGREAWCAESYARIVGTTPLVAARQLISRGFRAWAEQPIDPQLTELIEEIRVRARSLDVGPSVPATEAIKEALDLAAAAAEEHGLAASPPAPSDVTLEEALVTVNGILAHAEGRAEPSGAPVEPEGSEPSGSDLIWLAELRRAGGHDPLGARKEQ